MRLLAVRVRRSVAETPAIRSFELVAEHGGCLPPFSAGSHIDVHLPNGLVRQYSLCNDPSERHRYVIAVQREAGGRGASMFLHDRISEGDVFQISEPRNNFPLEETATRHLLVAGGIGITPILAMVRRLTTLGAHWVLFYCTRTPEVTAFRQELLDHGCKGKVVIHHDRGDLTASLNLGSLLREYAEDTHLYCCGPGSLIMAVREAASGWPVNNIHFEHFAADAVGPSAADTSFTVRLARTGAVYEVPPGRTILSVLKENGFGVPSSCEEGICGTCATVVLAGEVEHRDKVLSAAEQKRGGLIMICVSRARGELVLDL